MTPPRDQQSKCEHCGGVQSTSIPNVQCQFCGGFPTGIPMTILQEADVQAGAVKAAELEIAANHIRALRSCDAPLGVFVQQAINAALEKQGWRDTALTAHDEALPEDESVSAFTNEIMSMRQSDKAEQKDFEAVARRFRGCVSKPLVDALRIGLEALRKLDLKPMNCRYYIRTLEEALQPYSGQKP